MDIASSLCPDHLSTQSHRHYNLYENRALLALTRVTMQCPLTPSTHLDLVVDGDPAHRGWLATVGVRGGRGAVNALVLTGTRTTTCDTTSARTFTTVAFCLHCCMYVLWG